MGQGDWVDVSAVRREVDPAIYSVLQDLEAANWRLRRQGHKFGLYCPCGEGGTWIRVDGTPRNPAGQARRIKRQAALCPDRHELIHGGVSS
ncbi:hypothetical protein GCM10028783_42620 [Modestobacter muralis]